MSEGSGSEAESRLRGSEGPSEADSELSGLEWRFEANSESMSQ